MAVKGRVKGMKRASALLCALLFTASMGLTGCFGGLKEAYVASERIPALEEETAATRFSDAFASDLCVVTDEASYDPDFVTSQAAALFDMDDREVLYSKDVFERMYPASITKIMTALVAIKEGDLKSRVLVTDDAVITEPGATLCGIEPGDTLTLEQLLYGLMLPSGNDAGAAIAVHIAGSIEAFSDMMNEEAVRLGATGTHFVNPHGLNDPDHYTTAYDLYLIFNEALKYPVFRQIVGTTAYTANYHNKNSEPVSKTWKGSNWFMTGERETPDGLKVFGGKTGTTKAAGYCLIMASRDDSDKEYISVVLKEMCIRDRKSSVSWIRMQSGLNAVKKH